MKHGNIEILDLDFEFKLWKNKLSFLLTEVDLLKDRIHVLTREKVEWEINNKFNILLQIQSNAIRSLEKNIRTQEQEMAFYAEDYPIDTKHIHYTVHENIRLEMDKIIFRHNEIMVDIYPILCYPLSFSEHMDV